MYEAHNMEEPIEWFNTLVQMGGDRPDLLQREEGWIFS